MNPSGKAARVRLRELAKCDEVGECPIAVSSTASVTRVVVGWWRRMVEVAAIAKSVDGGRLWQ